MNLEQMKDRCPNAKPLGKVRLDHYRLTFRGGGNRCGVATVLPDIGSHVTGILWEITAGDERNLDIYEGFPGLYGKKTVTIKAENKKRMEAMLYEMNPPYRNVPAIPAGGYLRTIIRGCDQNRIDPSPVLCAVLQTYRECTELKRQEKKKRGPER